MYGNYQDPMYKSGQVFSITPLHVLDEDEKSPTIRFLAYINDFSENYDSNWSEEDVYGRMDGIHNFSSIKRTFNISLKVAAESYAEARNNMIKISRMIKYLYPAVGKNSYTNGDSKFENFYIRSAPIFKIKFGNIINSRDGYGLYGIIKGGFSIKPLHEHGWFIPPLEAKELINEKLQDQSYDVRFMYKYFDISFTFTVIHDHMLGTNPDLRQSNKNDLQENAYFKEFFPYLVYDKNKVLDQPLMSGEEWNAYTDYSTEIDQDINFNQIGSNAVKNSATEMIERSKLKKIMRGR